MNIKLLKILSLVLAGISVVGIFVVDIIVQIKAILYLDLITDIVLVVFLLITSYIYYKLEDK